MKLGEALGLAGDEASGLRFLPLEPAADRAYLETIAVQMLRFAPRIALDDTCRPLPADALPAPAAALLAEIHGTTHLWGGEVSYIEELADWFRLTGRVVRIAVADTIGAAWGAALAGVGADRGRIVPPGPAALRALCDELPLAALRLPPATAETFAELGWRTLREPAATDRTGWNMRFGPAPGLRFDQFFGRAPEWFAPVEPPSPEVVRCRWDDPLTQLLPLRHWFEQLLRGLAVRRAAREEGIVRLACRLQTEDGRGDALELRLLRPRRRPEHLAELLSFEWERRHKTAPLTAGIVGCELEVLETAPLPAVQRPLPGTEVSPHERDRADPEAEARLLERLGGRLGSAAVVRIVPVPDVDPALAWREEPWGEPPRAAPGRPRTRTRKPPRQRTKPRFAPHVDMPPKDATSEPTADRPAADDSTPYSTADSTAREATANAPTRHAPTPSGPTGNAPTPSSATPQRPEGLPISPAQGNAPPKRRAARGKPARTADGAEPEGGPEPAAFPDLPRPLRWAPRPLRLTIEPATASDPTALPERIAWSGAGTPGDSPERVCRARIVRGWGPERLAVGWWRDAPIDRDYYRAETDRGERLWIYRSRPDDTWFLHGWFD